MVNFSLEGKVALVTGGAYGIGFAIAEAFAQAGAKIAFNCRSQKHLEQALADYKAKGIDAKGYICDVTDEEAVKALVAQIEKELGVIDILVNNAGIIKRIPMCDMTVDEFRQVIDIDLNAPFIVSKAVIPGMIKKGHGKIINVCSMIPVTSLRNMANTTSNATVSVRAISLLRKPLPCVNVKRTVLVIRLMHLSYRRLRLPVGVLPKT